jgi:hypothetical protein
VEYCHPGNRLMRCHPGHAVAQLAQLVQALCYKEEGRGFETQ